MPDKNQQVEFEGTVHQFPPDFTADDISKALRIAHGGGESVPTAPSTIPATPKKPGFWNTFLNEVNPMHSVPGLIKAISTLPGIYQQPLSDEEVKNIQDIAHKQTLDPPGYSEIAGHMAAMGANAALLAATTHGLVKGGGAALDALTKANPVKDLATIYPNLDPKTVESAPAALADIKKNAPNPITSNEHLASVSPDYAVGPALKENRDAMGMWHNRAQNVGAEAQPNAILQATQDSLKKMSDPARKAAIMDEVHNQISQEPLTPNRLKDLLEEKNGELKSFYDRDPAVQSAAQQAGASTGRSQALLEAQAKALRETYYNLLDPANGGAGPREVQSRYGGIKNLTSEANSKRMAVQAETAGSIGEKAQNVALDLLNIPGKAVTGDIAAPFKAIKKVVSGTTDPLVERIFKNAPDATPLPIPTNAYYRGNPNAVRQLGAGPAVQVEGGGSPAVADTSGVTVGSGASNLPTRKALPAATTQFQGDISPGSGGGVGQGFSDVSNKGTDKVLPTKSDSSFVKSQAATPAVAEKTMAQARDEVSSRYMGRKYNSLSNGEKVIVDKLQQGRPLSISDLSNLGGK